MLRKLEKYDLIEEIGHGGMATVYRAVDRRLDREVAIKVMHPHLRQAKEAQERFTREAKSVAKLHHPNIMEIYDFSGEGSEESYIAAELLSGPTLRRCADEHPDLPPEVAAAFCVEIAQALVAAHKEGIVHRDVKPENVLLNGGSEIKLTDFGIARIRDGNSMTATGQILGSPAHMAPEQIDGRSCDARSDVFSLGTVLYFLSVGCLPFTGSNPHTVLKRVMDADFPDPLRVRPKIGEGLARIIRRAMELDPDDRYQTAEEFERALVEFLEKLGYEDANTLWSRYIASPDDVGAELHDRVVEQQTEEGEEALKAKELDRALACFNRVLAYDDTNRRVLSAIDAIGRRANRRRQVSILIGVALVVAGSLLIGMLGVEIWGEEQSLELEPEVVLDADVRPISDAQIQPVEEPAEAGTLAVIEDGVDAQVAAPENPTRVVSGPRNVVFRLPRQIQNVQISVNGGAARAYGPSFRSVELAPGRHTFRFSGRYVETRSITRNIPAGRGAFPLPVELQLKPSRLYVVANVPARVNIVGAGVGGQTRQFLSVPMDSSQREVTITVTAPGHRMYRGRVRLRVGELTQHQVQLSPSGGIPQNDRETASGT